MNLRVDVVPHGDGFVATLETTADDGTHWACMSDERPTRAAALFQCLAIAIANEQLD